MSDEHPTKMEKDVAYVKYMENPFRKYILQILTIVFIAGGGWVAMGKLETAVADNQTAIEESKELDAQFKERLAIIATNQEHLTDDVQEIKEMQREILRAVQEYKSMREREDR